MKPEGEEGKGMAAHGEERPQQRNCGRAGSRLCWTQICGATRDPGKKPLSLTTRCGGNAKKPVVGRHEEARCGATQRRSLWWQRRVKKKPLLWLGFVSNFLFSSKLIEGFWRYEERGGFNRSGWAFCGLVWPEMGRKLARNGENGEKRERERRRAYEREREKWKMKGWAAHWSFEKWRLGFRVRSTTQMKSRYQKVFASLD